MPINLGCSLKHSVTIYLYLNTNENFLKLQSTFLALPRKKIKPRCPHEFKF